MNNLSTSEPSRLQNTWSSLPWGTFLFLLGVFVFATPLFRGAFESFNDQHTMVDIMNRDNLSRILALISLGAFALFNLLRSKPGRFQINGLLGWLILFYLVLATLSIIWSIDPRFTVKRVGILLLLSLGSLYIADRLSLQETTALVLFISAVGILLGVFFVIQNNIFLPFNRGWRFGGNMHPNAQGWHCGLLLLSAFALSRTAEKNRAVYFGIAFIAFFLLLITKSRMSFLSCSMASAVYWGLTASKRYQGVLLFLGIISFGCVMYLLLGYEFKAYFENVISLNRAGASETYTTLTGRIPLWQNILEIVDLRPFFGFGYDSFLNAANLVWIEDNLGWATPSAHSGYLQTLGGMGYFGVVTLVLILLLSVKKSIDLARRNSEYAFIVAVLVWLIINMITESDILTRPFFAVFTWMIMLAKLGFIRGER